MLHLPVATPVPPGSTTGHAWHTVPQGMQRVAAGAVFLHLPTSQFPACQAQLSSYNRHENSEPMRLGSQHPMGTLKPASQANPSHFETCEPGDQCCALPSHASQAHLSTKRATHKHQNIATRCRMAACQDNHGQRTRRLRGGMSRPQANRALLQAITLPHICASNLPTQTGNTR